MGCANFKSAHKTCPSVYEPLDSADFAESHGLRCLLLANELLQPPPSLIATPADQSLSQLQPGLGEADLKRDCAHTAILSC